MNDFVERNRERIEAILRGQSLKDTARRLGINSHALHQQVSSWTKAWGVTTNQWRMQMALASINLWQSPPPTADELRCKWDSVRHEAKAEVDQALEGLGVSYLLTMEPELQILYMNDLGRTIYRIPPQQDIFGWSLWTAMIDASVWPLFNNLREYHGQRITMAKALMAMGSWMGPREEERTNQIITPYKQFCEERFPGLWDQARADYRAHNATYRKEFKHWNQPDISLKFQVGWTYRPEWQLYQVMYEPKKETVIHMQRLKSDLRSGKVKR